VERTERRKRKRIKDESKVVFRIVSKDDIPHSKNVSYSLTRDISLTGAKVLTDTLLPVDTTVKTRLMLGKAQKLINAVAKIRWVKTLYDDELFEMGVEFIDTNPESVVHLIEHIYRKVPEVSPNINH
jgi:c-di-GMP-binding flagellar brake protein YcgR